MTSLKSLVRWVGVLPAAALGYAAAEVLRIIGTFWLDDSHVPIIRVIFGSTVDAFAFVWAGSRMAPSGKEIVAITLGLVLAMGTGAVSLIGLANPNRYPVWESIAAAVMTLIGAGLAIVQTFREYHPEWLGWWKRVFDS